MPRIPVPLHRRVLLSILLTLVLLTSLPAFATDNVTGIHWHSAGVTYRLNSALPSNWKGATTDAATAWTDSAKLQFSRGSDTSSTNPDTSAHIVWRGQIPSSWQSGCPPDSTLACARWIYDSNNHLSDTDFVFNEEFSMGVNSLSCLLDLGFDVQTVALHELGHWGVLSHSSDSGAAMYGAYNGCKRTPRQHDIDSMNSNYANH